MPTRGEIPIVDLSLADSPATRPSLLHALRAALFDVGFLYVTNHGVPTSAISALASKLPALFALPPSAKAALSKQNSPHFLGYSGFAEETTRGRRDLREQFDFATELPAVWREAGRDATAGGEAGRDLSKLYWRLRGPNQWPDEGAVPDFRRALTEYHDAVQALSYRFVHLVEEAFGIPVGTFDHFFTGDGPSSSSSSGAGSPSMQSRTHRIFLPPQHRMKLLKYPPVTTASEATDAGQGVGPHKDSSGWLTFLLQVGDAPGLEVLSKDGEWITATPVEGSFVVNFGNAFEAATEGAVKATVHRVVIPSGRSEPRYSVPFFQGLPLDMTVSEVRSYIPTSVRDMRRQAGTNGAAEEVSSFLDPRWDSLGESQLRKWIRSHQVEACRWYDKETVEYYLA